MVVTMVHLTTLLLPWRLTSPDNGDNKAVNLKALMAAECASKLSNGVRQLFCF